MPKITVKTEYIDKLKTLGVYDAWLSNLKEQFDKRRNSYQNIHDFHSFVCYTSIWSETPEKYTFWSKVARHK